eukprot:4016374-Prymnesium_polylepis.1
MVAGNCLTAPVKCGDATRRARASGQQMVGQRGRERGTRAKARVHSAGNVCGARKPAGNLPGNCAQLKIAGNI